MNEIPPEGMSIEEFDELFEEDEYDKFDRLLETKIAQFMESLTSEQRENIPEIQALMMIFFIKEDNFERVLEMLRQSIKELGVDPNYLANWRSRVEAKLRETSNEELEIDNSQRQQIERVLLGLDQ
jgi:truncated hemoglobin YjbI